MSHRTTSLPRLPPAASIVFWAVSGCGYVYQGADFTVDDFRKRHSALGDVPAETRFRHPGVPRDMLAGTAWWHAGPAGEQPKCADGSKLVAQRATPSRTFWRCEETRSPPAEDASFSFLVWSCDEPYAIDPENGRTTLRDRGALMQLIAALRAQGTLTLDHKDWPGKPSFGVALGDQVYVDPDPDEVGPNGETLAAFGGDRSSSMHLTDRSGDGGPPDPAECAEFLDVLYESHFLRSPYMRSVFGSMPVAMMWDDHEIRDGWGSQGDETRPFWQSWFAVAQDAFRGWQSLRNPQPAVQYPTSFDTDFARGSVHFRLIDTRSLRSRDGGEFLGGQVEALEAWLSGLSTTKPQVIVLGVNTPLFVADTRSRALGAMKAELRDDLGDAWSRNPVARAAIMKALDRYFERHAEDRLLVLSGDIHESGLLRITRGGTVMGWEVVSSGVAADTAGDEGLTWLGLGNMVAEGGHGFTSDWAGRIAGSPAVAELRIDTHAEGGPRVEVAWYVSANDLKAKDDGAGTGLVPVHRLTSGVPMPTHARTAAWDRAAGECVWAEGTSPTGPSVLVDALEFGVSAGEALLSRLGRSCLHHAASAIGAGQQASGPWNARSYSWGEIEEKYLSVVAP